MREPHAARNCVRRVIFSCVWSLALAAAASRAAAAQLTIDIEPRWKGAVTSSSATVNNDAGQPLRLTRAAALLSGVSLWRPDGSIVRLDGQYGFIDAMTGRRQVDFQGIPEGDFVGLEFQIGVPANVNHADPGTWPAGHPLNPLANGLHWSWQGGYVFLAIEGRWTEANGVPSAAERGFSFHLARDPQLMTVRFAANYTIKGDTEVRLACDFARVLAALNLSDGDGSESTHSAEGDTLAPKLARNVERAWFWLEATPAPANRRRAGDADAAAIATATSGTPFAFTVPAGFPQPQLPADNPLTTEGIALGKSLFFDPRLSRGGTQSCANCHAADHAYSDSVALSHGADGRIGRRNAMPLFNLAWSPQYAWDGSQPKIRDQARAAWTSAIEMQADPETVVARLGEDPTLRGQFQSAFGSPEITAERIVLALEQFLLVQVAADSKFDRSLRGEAELTTEEKRGFELFVTEFDPARGRRGADCFHCHGGALFTDYALKNNGLAGTATETATNFKTPSLRNVALTAPYMHDGRFGTLEEVVAHYDHGVERNATLDPNLAKHPTAGLQLSTDDQRALVAFLLTLTDLPPAHSSPSQ